MNKGNRMLLAATAAMLAACGGGGGGAAPGAGAAAAAGVAAGTGAAAAAGAGAGAVAAAGGGGGGGANQPSQSQSYAPINVSAKVSDNVGVVRLKFLLNGSVMCDLPTSSQPNVVQIYSCQVTPVQGANVIAVQAVDAAGNVGADTVTAQGQ